MMRRSLLSVAIAAAVTVPGSASAGQAEEMEKTLQALQAQVVAMQAEIAKMKEEQAASSSGVEWANNVSIGGAVEFVMPEGGAGSLDTLELEISVQATENTSAYVKLKEASGVQVDEASITHDFGVVAVSATTGGHPFGDFSTSMVSDSLTKTVGDTDADGARLVAEAPLGESVMISAGLDDDASSIAATAEIGGFGVTVGHITDVNVDATKSANHLAASYAVGDFTLFAEWVNSDGAADATNVEAAYAFTVAGRDAAVALGRQELKNTVDATNYPNEKRNMFTATLNVDEGLDLSVEKMDSDNSANDAWQAKIAYGF